MRYRKLDAARDYSFGHGGADFHVDTPEAVAQAVLTRLFLLRGEWFLDSSEGMPWSTEVLGSGTSGTYDQAIRRRILETAGVTGITSYSSQRVGRSLAVAVLISTQYGATQLRATL